MEYYIHQIGDIHDGKTYEILVKILKSKTIASRKYLEQVGEKWDSASATFKQNIPKDKEWMYYKNDIHKDRVSLSDPFNRFIKKAIELKSHQFITCFDYNFLAFAISREVPIVSKDETQGLALGEVQVKDKIDSEYIVGLIVPFQKEDMSIEENVKYVDMLSQICEKYDFKLNIYNYEGELLKCSNKGKVK